jgi:hypothetical protein
MPRPSAASLNIVPIGVSPAQSPTPLGSLSKAERKVFDHAVATNGHLKRADIPMLELYATAHCRAVAKKRKGGQEWEREARVTMALGRSLRLTVQATTEPRTAARRRAEGYSGNPWDRNPWDDDVEEWDDNAKRRFPNNPNNPDNKKNKSQ